MKKSLIVILCLLSFASNAQQFRYGFTVAPAIGWWHIEGDQYISSGNKFGVQVGGIIDQTLGSAERFSLTTGLNYNICPGGMRENERTPDPKEYHFAVNTLDLPLTVRLRSDELNDNTVLYAQYGLTLGFKIRSNITVGDGKNGGNQLDYAGTTTSLTMGVGLEHTLSGDKSLIIGAFFQNGIKNVVTEGTNDTDDDNFFPQQVGIRGGILF